MIIIKYYNLYVPLNQNTNSFRHYGIKFDKILFFELHELFHVISSDMRKDYPPFIKAYFDMKSRYNLLRDGVDLSLIIPFNRHLYTEMLSSNKYIIDKFILKNAAVIDWEEILREAPNKLNNKEMGLFQNLSEKLLKHETYFRKFDDFIVNPSIPPVPVLPKSNLYTLFNIIEEFNNFSISFPAVDNNSNYLKSQSKTSSEINLLDYLQFKVYHCKTNFSRTKDKPLSDILFINKYVKIKDMLLNLKNKIVCCISNNEYVILNVKEKILDTKVTPKHIKKRKTNNK
ncbi:uncharacterized protein VNE69_01022 [Vairimorpha necatrix]|uniref:Uncharacterized protein n=1 Tax=Vairimorpha necatrix TaxID=6039 RepID=A0AAX4J846_9MICR